MDKKKTKRRSPRKSSLSSSESDSEFDQKVRKLKKKLKKERKKTEKFLKKRLKEERRKLKRKNSCKSESSRDGSERLTEEPPADIPLELMEMSKVKAPMTKEEWDKRQSIIRKVLDEETGRYRLIKGDGEVIEEIVSRDQHRQINKQATLSDGAFFQSQTVDKKVH